MNAPKSNHVISNATAFKQVIHLDSLYCTQEYDATGSQYPVVGTTEPPPGLGETSVPTREVNRLPNVDQNRRSFTDQPPWENEPYPDLAGIGTANSSDTRPTFV